MSVESYSASPRPEQVFEVAIAVGILRVGDDTVVFDQLRARSFRLNSTASTIWQLLEKRPTLAAIIEEVADKYDISVAESDEAVRGFMAKLLEIGVVAATDYEVTMKSEIGTNDE